MLIKKFDIKKYNILTTLIGIFIIFIVLYNTDLVKIIEIIKKIDIRYLLFAVMAYLLGNLVMSYRLHSVLEKVDKKIRLNHVFWAHMSGMIASDVTPARSGYMYSVIPLKKKGVNTEKAISVITYCYAFDLIMKGIAGSAAVLFLLSLIVIPYDLFRIFAIGLGSIVFFVFIGLAFLNLKFSFKIKNIFEKHKIGRSILQIQSESKNLNRLIPLIFSISIIGWIIRGLEWYFIAKAVNLDMALVQSLLLHPLLTSLSMVPFTSAGLGIQEFGISEAMKLLGFTQDASIAFALVIRVMNTSVDLIGLKGFFLTDVTGKKLKDEYEGLSGNIDETAYNSNILVQRYWQRRRVDEIIKNLHVMKNDFILDIGCGSGVISQKCIENGGSVVSFDLSYKAVKYVRDRGLKNSFFLVADAQNLPFKPDTFNAAVCTEVIEHLPEPEKMINEITRVLKVNGKICVTTPNSHSFWPIIELLWDRFGRGRDYGETHLRIFNKKSLSDILNNYNIYHTETLFVLTPFVALSNSEKLLEIAKNVDYKMEAQGIGAVILMCGKKKEIGKSEIYNLLK